MNNHSKQPFRMIAVFILMSVVVLGLSCANVSAKTYKNFNYTVMKNGKVRLNSYAGKKKTLTIPKKIKGKKVTTISKSFRIKKNKTKKVIIHKGITKIYPQSFSSSNLKSIQVSGKNKKYKAIGGVLFSKKGTVLIRYPRGKTAKSYTVPANVKKIGVEAFERCKKLTSIKFKSSKVLKTIDKEAFYGVKIKSIALPDSVQYINSYAFESTKITKFNVPKSLKKMGYGVFAGSYVKEVFIPKEVKELGSGAFNDALALKKINVETGNTHIKFENNTLFTNKGKTINIFLNNKKASTYTIPKDVTIVDSYAFYNKGLKKIEFEEGSKAYKIKKYAFSGNYNLSTLILPESMKYIGYGIIEESSIQKLHLPKNVISINPEFAGYVYDTEIMIKEVTVDKNNKYYTGHQGVLYNKKMTQMIYYPIQKTAKTYTIPSGVQKVNIENIHMNNSLGKLKFPASVKKIGKVPNWEGVYGVDFTIYCKKNSYTHKYAKKNRLKYKFY